MVKKILLAMVLLVCLQTAGCQYINPIGPIVELGIMWYQGEANKYYNTDQATLLEALKLSLQELDLVVTEESSKENVVYLTAGDNQRFHIKVVMVRSRTTKLSIRVNIMGDHPYAELVYRHVDNKPGVTQYESLVALNTDVTQ